MKKFDLTTQSGLVLAQNFLGQTLITSPILILGKYIFDKLFSTPEEQGKVVRDLIEKGKKEDVDEMEIELIDKGGLNLNITVR